MLICRILLVGMVAVCGSCRQIDNIVYSDFMSFGSGGWDPACVLPFSPLPMDSVMDPDERYDLILTLRYSSIGASSDIPLEITEEDENGVTGTRVLKVHLRHDNGKPRGRKGICLYEISDTLRGNFKLPDGYMVEIASLSPASNTVSLRNIGLTLSKTAR